jgi:transcription-repair coupling factor (superfamily II helicase)
VIATHRLLHAHARFKDLGLLIIDEEHRFGVRDKQRLQALRANVHVLTLTATPIPRTLNMALGGLRDLSLITTAPVARLAIKTFLIEWHAPTLREAALRELRRGGQIYFVHNEVPASINIRRTGGAKPEGDGAYRLARCASATSSS